MLRLYILYSVGRTSRARQTGEAPDPGLLGGGDALGSFWKKLMGSSKDYFKALLALDRISCSWSYTLLNCLSFVSFLWGGLGVYFSLLHIVEDEVACPANTMRVVAHIYAFTYVVLFFWSLLSMVLWLGGLLLCSDMVALAVLRRAWNFDKMYSPSGLPVCALLLRALLLRNGKDMAILEASVLRGEIEELREEQAAVGRLEAELAEELRAAECRLAETSQPTSAEELSCQYKEQLASAIDKVAVVGVALTQQFKAHGETALEELQTRTQHAMTLAQGQVQELAEAAQTKASEAGLEEAMSQVQGRAQELVETAQRQAKEAGLEDLTAKALGGADALQDFACQALLQAQAAGIDLEQLLQQAVEVGSQTAEEAAALAKRTAPPFPGPTQLPETEDEAAAAPAAPAEPEEPAASAELAEPEKLMEPAAAAGSEPKAALAEPQ